MRFAHFLPLILVVMVASGCTKMTTVRHAPNYKSAVAGHKEVLILPPLVEVNTVDIAGRKERMYDYETHLEDIITREMVKPFEDKGFRVKSLKRRDIYDLKLFHSFTSLRDSYNLAREELYSKLLWEEDKAFSITKNLGRDATILGEGTNGDLLIMVDYAQIVKTNGARTRDLALNILFGVGGLENVDSSSMVIGIIDTKNGDLLWANISHNMSDIFSSGFESFSSQDKVDIKKVNKLIKAILDPLKKENP